MASVFIKRYPSKGELPKENNKDYCSNVGMVYFRKGNFYFRDEQLITFTNKVEWFLEEIELPSDDEIDKSGDDFGSTHIDGAFAFNAFMHGANFILNKLKGEIK